MNMMELSIIVFGFVFIVAGIIFALEKVLTFGIITVGITIFASMGGFK